VLHLFAGPVLGHLPGGDERGVSYLRAQTYGVACLADDDQRSPNCIRKTDPPGSQQAYAWAVFKERPRPPKWIDGCPWEAPVTSTTNLAGDSGPARRVWIPGFGTARNPSGSALMGSSCCRWMSLRRSSLTIFSSLGTIQIYLPQCQKTDSPWRVQSTIRSARL